MDTTSPRQKIDEWLEKWPEKAVDIASAAVCGLYIRRGEIVQEVDSFVSGADYIDFVVAEIDDSGLGALIEELRRE